MKIVHDLLPTLTQGVVGLIGYHQREMALWKARQPIVLAESLDGGDDDRRKRAGSIASHLNLGLDPCLLLDALGRLPDELIAVLQDQHSAATLSHLLISERGEERGLARSGRSYPEQSGEGLALDRDLIHPPKLIISQFESGTLLDLCPSEIDLEDHRASILARTTSRSSTLTNSKPLPGSMSEPHVLLYRDLISIVALSFGPRIARPSRSTTSRTSAGHSSGIMAAGIFG